MVTLKEIEKWNDLYTKIVMNWTFSIFLGITKTTYIIGLRQHLQDTLRISWGKPWFPVDFPKKSGSSQQNPWAVLR